METEVLYDPGDEISKIEDVLGTSAVAEEVAKQFSKKGLSRFQRDQRLSRTSREIQRSFSAVSKYSKAFLCILEGVRRSEGPP